MERAKNRQLAKGIIIGLTAGLILGGVAGYLLHNNINRSFMQRGGNFQINEETKNSIISFFESTSDMNEINSYCEQNRINCLYYCMNINPNHEICKMLTNYTSRQGGQPWNQ
jgi:hypothetical protein